MQLAIYIGHRQMIARALKVKGSIVKAEATTPGRTKGELFGDPLEWDALSIFSIESGFIKLERYNG